MKKIIFASNNENKLKEIKQIFKDYEVLSLINIGFKDKIVENGRSFQANAYKKAKAVYDYMKKHLRFEYPIIADDSGLCVKAINYEPGIYSARYTNKGDEANRQKLLKKLTTIQDRTAYFQCYAVLIMPNGEEIYSDAKTYGLITKEKIGDETFGYDCLFWSTELRKTFGQSTAEEKNSVSHRAKAMVKIKEYLDNSNYSSFNFEYNDEE